MGGVSGGTGGTAPAPAPPVHRCSQLMLQPLAYRAVAACDAVLLFDALANAPVLPRARAAREGGGGKGGQPSGERRMRAGCKGKSTPDSAASTAAAGWAVRKQCRGSSQEGVHSVLPASPAQASRPRLPARQQLGPTEPGRRWRSQARSAPPAHARAAARRAQRAREDNPCPRRGSPAGRPFSSITPLHRCPQRPIQPPPAPRRTWLQAPAAPPRAGAASASFYCRLLCCKLTLGGGACGEPVLGGARM